MTQPSEPMPNRSYPISGGLTPSQTVYTAVAEAKECDALDLPPLAWTIDPDALDSIVTTATSPDEVTVEFDYAGCSLTVTAGEVRVADE